MQNWYAMEVEAASRRQEWEREVAAEARIARVRCRTAGSSRRWIARILLAARLGSAAPRLATPSTARHAAPAC